MYVPERGGPWAGDPPMNRPLLRCLNAFFHHMEVSQVAKSGACSVADDCIGFIVPIQRINFPVIQSFRHELTDKPSIFLAIQLKVVEQPSIFQQFN